ncbi:ABC transporter ATP-binding protein [Leptolyngbyaceae cyanobacterium CCMR0082]|uniref:ABC transporter ATP-binding protein n=2 Tax=Adonisia turfae TaxID=2950184 RepID=A0A6M0SD26_9CYAN|nr:ABC transporter ATP-binding protein [Adonisia turfae]MDV3351106.1 ABC transporter ATP-binding protein [Leptothoe sp. LEGE 181152]NEZ58746.1 ABC transporter ATP-binding protein [Adonisia turfae CCMR0081]NEZ66397.1 ABC transporter ATP-binding protein [Adonisia turfae CCMR0082]
MIKEAVTASAATTSKAKGSVNVEGISMIFNRKGHSTQVLDSVNLHIKPGELVCLLGPSGCGKSTLLNIIAGFIKPTAGYVMVDQKQVRKPGADRGFVFQQYSLLPWKTTYQNVEFGLKIKGIPKAEREDMVGEYLNLVGLGKYRNAYPRQLSGGMQQRASIVRALVNSPSVLLMDEPFAALDAQTRHMMQELLLNIWETLKTTVIFVTHDIEEAVFLGDRIFVMGVQPGRIKAELDIPLVRPRHVDDILTPEFSQLNRQVFELIREETLKSMETH